MVFDTNNKEYIIPLNIFSGSNGKYRISIYLNHNLIKAFDNHEYLDIDCEKETVYNLCFSIDPDNIKNNNHMYAIAVPIDYEYENSICEVVKSDSVVITIN